MGSYVSLLITDPRRRLVVADHYIGGSHVAWRIREVLLREPDHAMSGFESWGKVTPDEIREILREDYANGFFVETLAECVDRLPPERYIWCLSRAY